MEQEGEPAMMTREEAIKALRLERGIEINGNAVRVAEFLQGLDVAISALRPVSREQVEKVWKGEWRDLHGDKLIGIDDWGQDVYRHYHYSVCKKCGKGIAAKSNFCPYCGDAKTDKAVQMVMERWEALTNVKTD